MPSATALTLAAPGGFSPRLVRRSRHARNARAPIFRFCPGIFSPGSLPRRGVFDFRIQFGAHENHQSRDVNHSRNHDCADNAVGLGVVPQLPT